MDVFLTSMMLHVVCMLLLGEDEMLLFDVGGVGIKNEDFFCLNDVTCVVYVVVGDGWNVVMLILCLIMLH